MDDQKTQIITVKDLKNFFYQELSLLNNHSLCPVPQETIFYSSDVLDKFALSQDFFEFDDGKVKEKVLGLKLLESNNLSRDEQRKVIQEVAEMSLMVTGYFGDSLNKKLVDRSYYINLGQTAYCQLNSHIPELFDIPHFFKAMATSFETLTTLIHQFSKKYANKMGQKFLLNVSDRGLLTQGIMPLQSKKIC